MKIVAIIATTSGCGRSTLALNYAMAYSWNREQDALVLDLGYGDPKVQWMAAKYGVGNLDASSFVNSSISDENLLQGAIFIPTCENKGVRILPAPPTLSMLAGEFDDVKSREELLNLQSRVATLEKSDIGLLLLVIPPYLLESYLALNYMSLCDAVLIVTTENPAHLVSTGRAGLKELFCCINARTGILINFFIPPSVPSPQNLEAREIKVERRLNAPVIACFPFLWEFIHFPVDGIEYVEKLDQETTWKEFFEVINHVESAVYDLLYSSTPPQPRTEVAVRPAALFVAEAISGRTIFSHFFGQSVQNPALVTASMVGVANIVSESAGRIGELRLIDNGNMKILVQRGRQGTMGILYCSQTNTQLQESFERFILEFEEGYGKEISVLKRTGIVKELKKVEKLVEKRFSEFTLRVTAAKPELSDLIEEFAKEREIDDPEAAFQEFLGQNLPSETIKLLEYEFTVPHAHERHILLAEAGIRPSKQRIKELENEIGYVCQCWLQAELRPLDIFALLSLPDNLQGTAKTILRLGIDEITSKAIAQETGRSEGIEQSNLEELVTMGFLRKGKGKTFLTATARETT
ncbi:MAG: hypothetical protein ACFFGZ_16230 [Candidatus Thorarchaeota archaeon]